MGISISDLKLEIGSEAYNDLTSDEVAAITSKYSSSQIRLAGMKAFELLMKKFKPSYRMGKTYKALSDKYVAYQRMYEWYCSTLKAGKISAIETTTAEKISKYKWRE